MALTISVARWAFKMRPVINGAEFCGMHVPAVSAYANKRKKWIWMKGLGGNRRCIPLPVRMHMRKTSEASTQKRPAHMGAEQGHTAARSGPQQCFQTACTAVNVKPLDAGLETIF